MVVVGFAHLAASSAQVPLHVSVAGDSNAVQSLHFCLFTTPPMERADESLVDVAEAVGTPSPAPVVVTAKTAKAICRLCSKKITMFRKEKACGRCSELACTSCVTSVNGGTLGWKAPMPVCSACMPGVREEIDGKKNVDPVMQKRDSMQVDAAIDRMLIDAEQHSTGSGCAHCEAPFSVVRPEQHCSECGSRSCGFCCKLYSVRALGKKEPVAVCLDCLPIVAKKLTAALHAQFGVAENKQRARSELSQVEMVLHGNLRTLVNHERAFTEAEIKNMEKGKTKCVVCEQKFSLFVVPQRCSECLQAVCVEDSSEIAVAPALIGQGPTFCKRCYAGVRKRLMLQVAANSQIADDVRFAVADADDVLLTTDSRGILNALEKEGVKEAKLKKKTCIGCEQPFGLFCAPERCRQCDRFVCNSNTCSGLFFVPSLSTDQAVTLCFACVTKVDTKAPPRGSMAFGKLNNNQRSLIQSKQSCRVCQSDFSFFLRARSCDKCRLSACRNCIADGVTCVSLKFESQCLCRLCILESKSEVERMEAASRDLQLLGEAYARAGGAKEVIVEPALLSPRVKAGLSHISTLGTGNDKKVTATPIGGSSAGSSGQRSGGNDNNNNASDKSSSGGSSKGGSAGGGASGGGDGGGGGALVVANKRNDPQKKCELCRHEYSVLRKQKQCSECSRLCCGQCVGLFFLKSLGEAKARYICVDCLSGVRDTMIKSAAALGASDVAASQRAIKEAAAVSLSYAGNMFPPLTQADFSKEDVSSISRGTLKCTYCEERFTVQRPPSRCTECRLCVCSDCCFHFRLLHFFMAKTRPSTVCRECWPDTLAALTSALDQSPALWREGQEAMTLGNYFLGGAQVVTRVCRVSPEATLPPQCRICEKKLGLFRVPACCAFCNHVVCPGVACSGLLYVPSKSLSSPTVVCVNCLDKCGFERQSRGDFPPSAELLPLQVEMLSDGAKRCCSACDAVFTFLNPPFECSLRMHSVCRKCCRRRPGSLSNACKKCLVADGSPDARLCLEAVAESSEDGEEVAGERAVAVAAVAAAPLPSPTSSSQESCSVCLKKYSPFRKAAKCSNCAKGVCSSCSNELNFAWDKPRTICTTCELEVREKAKTDLEELKKKQLQRLQELKEEQERVKNSVSSGFALVSPKGVALVSPKAGALVSPKSPKVVATCKCCDRRFGFLRLVKTCAECTQECCNHCVGLYMLRSLGDEKPRHVCLKCLPGVLKRVSTEFSNPNAEFAKRAEKEASALRIVLAGNTALPSCKMQFNNDEVTALRKASCSVCSSAFDLMHNPRKCTECSRVVCSKCSLMPRSVAGRVLGRTDFMVSCFECWNGFRTKLLNAATTTNSKEELRTADHVNRMVMFMDAVLEKNHPVRDDVPPGTDLAVLGKQKCKVCENRFGIFRPPLQCVECQEFVCNSYSCSATCLVNKRSATVPVPVCATCLANVDVSVGKLGALRLQYSGRLSVYQMNEIEKERSGCDDCGKEFSYFVPPYQCSQCVDSFCHSCSVADVGKASRMCRKCAPGHRNEMWRDWHDSSCDESERLTAAVSEMGAASVARGVAAVSHSGQCALCDDAAKLAACSNCRDLVCTHCSVDGESLRAHLPWMSMGGVACRACLLREKDRIEDGPKKKTDPVIPAIDAALLGMSRRRDGEEVKEERKESRQIMMTLRGKISGVKKDRATASTAFAEKAAGAMRCQVCKGQTHVCLLPTPVDTCSVCSRVCCGGCASVLRLTSRPPKKGERTVCRDCVPALRADIGKDASAHRDACKLDLLLAGAVLDIKTTVTESQCKGKSCGECKQPFSLGRRPFDCAECGNLTCDRDAKHLPLLGYLANDSAAVEAYMVCRSCWPSAKSKLESAVVKGPAELRGAAMLEIEFGDTWLGSDPSELPEDPRADEEAQRIASIKADSGCGQCKKTFSLRRHPRLCCSCKKLVCAGSACGGNIMCPTADANRPVFLCVECLGSNWNTVLVARKPSASHRYPLQGRALELVDEEAECAVCEKRFSFWRRPNICSECEGDVCNACSDNDVSSRTVNVSRARVCKPCMPGLKTRIEEVSSENPRLEAQAKQEMALIDKSIEMEPFDEGETVTAAEWRSKHAKAAAKVAEGKDDACSVCHKAYGVFRKKKSCNQCESAVCTSCSHEFKMPSLGWSEQRRICDPCLPTVLAQLDKVTGSSTQLQKDRRSVMTLLGSGGGAKSPTATAKSDVRKGDGDGSDSDGSDSDSSALPSPVATSGKPRPKIAPLNLPGMHNSSGNVSNPVAKLLSPRYSGPVAEPDPLCPHRELDWAKVLECDDLHKLSQKEVTKRKLAAIATMRERLMEAKRKYVAELSNLENQAMKEQAEAQRNVVTLKLQEAVGNFGHGSQFFLSLDDGTVAPSSAWGAPFVVPAAKEIIVTLLSGETRESVGSVTVNVGRIQPEDLEAGTVLTMPFLGGQIKVFVRSGGKQM